MQAPERSQRPGEQRRVIGVEQGQVIAEALRLHRAAIDKEAGPHDPGKHRVPAPPRNARVNQYGNAAFGEHC